MTVNQVSQAQLGVDPPRVVDTIPALREMVTHLMQYPLVGVDTEANSLFAYRERVCLIQFSVPGTNYLVDPLAMDDLSPLGPVFSSSNIEKIFHAADYDLSVLNRDFGFTCSSLFDTMWAGRVLGWSKVGLGDILEKYFKKSVNKRYQRYNWGKRPVDSKALTYAWICFRSTVNIQYLNDPYIDELPFPAAVGVHRRILAIAVDGNVILADSQKLLEVGIEIDHLMHVLCGFENTQFPSVHIYRGDSIIGKDIQVKLPCWQIC